MKQLFKIMICIVSLLPCQSVWAQKQDFIYNDHGRRDPFWPLVTTSGSVLTYDTNFSVNELHLEGVMVGANGRNIAIINGLIVSKGGKLGEFIIQEIHSDAVILIKNNEQFELKLKKEE